MLSINQQQHQLKIFLWEKLLLLCIFITGIIIQCQGFLSHDVSWLLHATRRLLTGGTYTSNFFEINPPMALYIHILPVLFAQFLKISLISSMRIYVFSLALISLLLCINLLKKIIRPTHRILYFVFLLALVVDFTITPINNFAQREHIALILILPYLLSVIVRADNHELHDAIFIGLLAGVGFAIKPHLYITFLFVESYLFLVIRNAKILFRNEMKAIFFVLVIYITAVFLFNFDYLLILPYIYNFFSVFFESHTATQDMFFNYRVLFVVEAAIIYHFLYRFSSYKNLINVLMVAMLGFLIFFIAEPIVLDYHTIPMFSLAIILSLFLFCESIFVSNNHINHFNVIEILTLSAITLIIFCIPILTTISNLREYLTLAQDRNTVANRLIQYVDNFANKKFIYVFSTNCRLTYPLVDYTKVESASRYECLWPVFYIEKILRSKITIKAKIELEQQRLFLTNTIIEDMKKNMPELVFVSQPIYWSVFEDASFDYIKFFSQATEFKNIWKNYSYVTSIDDVEIYKRI